MSNSLRLARLVTPCWLLRRRSHTSYEGGVLFILKIDSYISAKLSVRLLMADSPKVDKAFSLTRTIRPRECEVSRYRHGCDPPNHTKSLPTCNAAPVTRSSTPPRSCPAIVPLDVIVGHVFSFHENWK
jgi:hypothetical protein